MQENMSNLPWVQKYLPSSPDDLIGQEKAILQLRNFLQQKKKKAVLLYGPPGCGKTSSVYALAEELNFEVLEINASDARNQAAITELLGAASQQMSLFAKSKLILVDEIDGVSGTKDRGGIPALLKILDKTAFPVVMTANDISHKKFKGLRKLAEMIEYELLDHTVAYEVLSRIVKKENIDVEEDALKSLARRSGGDMRGLITDVQLLTAGRDKLTKEDIDDLSERNRTETMEQALMKVFKSTDLDMVMHAFDDVEEDLNKTLLWVDENYPAEYPEKESRARAAYAIAKADIFLGRIRRWQHWRFLVYVNALLSGGVAIAKDERSKKPANYKQPGRILKIFIANMRFQKQRAIAEKIAAESHSSSRHVLQDTLPFFKKATEEKPEFATQLAEGLDLDAAQEEWLSKTA